MRILFLVSLIIFGFKIPVARAENELVQSELNGSVEGEVMEAPFIPEYEDYAVERLNYTVSRTLDVSEYEDKVYKNILLKEYNEDPNLSYKYIVIPVMCGSNCQTNFIANKETGKIIDDIGSTWGLKTKVNSNLLIADDYAMPLNKPYFKNALTSKIRYYMVEDDQIKLISEVPYEEYYKAKKVNK